MASHVEQHVSFGFVSETLVDQLADHADHFGNVLCRARFDIRALDANGTHVIVVGLDVPGRNLLDRLAGLDRRRVYLVVDIGDVASKSQLVTAPEYASEEIEDHSGSRIANVGVVVNRWPTEIHRHLAVVERFKWDFATLACVVYLNSHGCE